MRLILLALLAASPGFADPLELIDYEAFFAQDDAIVENVDDTRSTVMVDDVMIIRDQSDGTRYTGVDQSGQGAVGCFVSVLAALEAAQQACDITLSQDQLDRQASYRRLALIFYGRNVQPPTTLENVQARYAALVATEVEASKQFCDAPDEFTDFADRLFAPQALAEIEGMMSVPRLPVANPCL